MDQINWVLVFLVGNFGLSLFNSISSRHKVAQDELAVVKSGLKQEIDMLANKLSGHAERLSHVESTVDKSPTHDDLGEIYKEIRGMSHSVSELSSKLSGTSAKLDAFSDLLQRMDRFWRDQNKG